jgi:hypothetical protein
MEILRAITIKTIDRKTIKCMLMEIVDQTAIVCSESEWLQAQRENREPMIVGFPIENTSLFKEKCTALGK